MVGAFGMTVAKGPCIEHLIGALCWLAAALILINSTLDAQTTTLIQDAFLIDGTGGEPQPHTDILIRNGHIASITRTGSITAPKGAMVVEASGKTVIPGIINIRALAGFVRGPELSQDHFSQSSIQRHLASFAAYGVTTTATPAPQPSQLQAAQAEGKTARALTPVRTICAEIPAAYRDTILESAFEIVQSVKQARRAVEKAVDEGAVFIEFRDTDTSLQGDRTSQLAIATVKRANRRKRLASVITHRAELALAAIRAGARTVAASVNDSEVGLELIGEMVTSKAIYAPALFAELSRFAYEDRPEWIDDRYLRRSLPSGISGTATRTDSCDASPRPGPSPQGAPV